MIVCHCHGVSDRAIRKAVRDGARSASEVSAECAAGAGCGGCTEVVDEIIRAEAGHPQGPANASIVQLPLV